LPYGLLRVGLVDVHPITPDRLVTAEVEDDAAVQLHPVDPDGQAVRTKRYDDFLPVRGAKHELRSRASFGDHAGTLDAGTVTFVELKLSWAEAR
jgi:hypothetical protein